MKNINVKTALTAVTLAAAAIATPLSAQARDYNDKCGDTSNAVIGAVVGGTAGAAIGDRIASRGNSTEIGILGAIIGGVAGAAVGDSASDCEHDNRYSNNSYNNGRVTTTTHYPARTTTQYPTRTTTHYPTQTTNRVYQTAGHSGRSYGTTTYGNNRGYNNTTQRLYQVQIQIDDLKREREFLKKERRRSYSNDRQINRRLNRVENRLDDLRRERKQLRKYADNRRNNYRTTTTYRRH